MRFPSDEALKEFLVYQNETSSTMPNFILRNVDETRLLVKNDPVIIKNLRDMVEKWHNENSFALESEAFLDDALLDEEDED